MTELILSLDRPSFQNVQLVDNGHRPSELLLTVKSMGHINRFTPVKPFFTTPKGVHISDAEAYLQKEWSQVRVFQHKNDESTSYTLECSDNTEQVDRIAIHARDYRNETNGSETT